MNFVRDTVKEGKIKIGKNTVDLSAKLSKDQLKAYEGKEVVFGFRPEAIALEKAENSYEIKGLVELTELLGDNTNVYMDMDGVKSILKIDPHFTPAVDSKISFHIPYESVYLFDGETEKAIK